MTTPRPFLVDLLESRAASSQGDWTCEAPTPELEGLTFVQRARLAQHWTEVALLEHASIAGIARLSLQLLSLGAPTDLVEAANRALADETKHARLCFALATAYRGEPVEPEEPITERSPSGEGPESILRGVIRQSCVGFTQAALGAAHALSLCEDYAVSEVLEEIANDEARHAELAFRIVQWLIGERPELRCVAAEEFEEALACIDADAEPTGVGELRSFGVLDDGALARVRRRALGAVVGPYVERLFEGAPGERLLATTSSRLPRLH
jgi:hypothetical protein